uniref:Uncharacterized protein n=1 Tax=Syphacia muris TaxID=451379 RepID=A0A158R4K2_9BILA
MATAQQPKLRHYNYRPSQLNAFLSRIGFKRDDKRTTAAATAAVAATADFIDRSKKPNKSGIVQSQDTNNYVADELCGLSASVSQQQLQQPQKQHFDRRNSAEGSKVKRRSSSFLRLVHRISMNRKTFARNNSADTLSCTTPTNIETTVQQIDVPSPSVSSATVETSPHPAWSENDLRHFSTHINQTPNASSSPMNGTANAFSSENNLFLNSVDSADCKRHIPSYLRISCALNGYPVLCNRQISGKQQQSLFSSPSSAVTMPLGLVERRTLVFQNKHE